MRARTRVCVNTFVKWKLKVKGLGQEHLRAGIFYINTMNLSFILFQQRHARSDANN